MFSVLITITLCLCSMKIGQQLKVGESDNRSSKIQRVTLVFLKVSTICTIGGKYKYSFKRRFLHSRKAVRICFTHSSSHSSVAYVHSFIKRVPSVETWRYQKLLATPLYIICTDFLNISMLSLSVKTFKMALNLMAIEITHPP